MRNVRGKLRRRPPLLSNGCSSTPPWEEKIGRYTGAAGVEIVARSGGKGTYCLDYVLIDVDSGENGATPSNSGGIPAWHSNDVDDGKGSEQNLIVHIYCSEFYCVRRGTGCRGRTRGHNLLALLRNSDMRM